RICICGEFDLAVFAVPDLGNIIERRNLWFIYSAFDGSCFSLIACSAYISLCIFYRVQRNITSLGPIEPASPEPIEVLTTCIFKCTEEICRLRMFERPATRILFKGI